MRYARLLLLCLFALIARPVSAQQISDSVHAQSEYPILPRLSDGEAIKMMAKLGLHPMYLAEDRIMYNYYRNLKRDVIDTLRVGTLVYADVTDTPRYKASCWNRLREMLRCPACITARLIDSAATADSLKRHATSVGGPSDSSRFWSHVWHNLGSILEWLIPLLCLLALLWLVLRWLTAGEGHDTGGGFARSPMGGEDPLAPAPVRTTPTPAPVAVPAPAPAATATPAPAVSPIIHPDAPAAPTRIVSVDDPEPALIGGHTLLVTAHPDGSHSIHSSAGVNSVDMMRFGANRVDVGMNHDGFNK